jgi:hypothetical protein
MSFLQNSINSSGSWHKKQTQEYWLSFLSHFSWRIVEWQQVYGGNNNLATTKYNDVHFAAEVCTVFFPGGNKNTELDNDAHAVVFCSRCGGGCSAAFGHAAFQDTVEVRVVVEEDFPIAKTMRKNAPKENLTRGGLLLDKS